MGQTITVRLTKELSAWLTETAQQTGMSQGELVRLQLEKAKTSRGQRRFMRLAGTMRGAKNLSQRKGFSPA